MHSDEAEDQSSGQPQPSTSRGTNRGMGRRPGRPRGRGPGRPRGRGGRQRSRSPVRRRPDPWKDCSEEDVAPHIPSFQPVRAPGVQLNRRVSYTPLALFQLFFTPEAMAVLCANSNSYAQKNKEAGKKYEWTDVDTEEMYRFLGIITYTTLCHLPSLPDYWALNSVTSQSVPRSVMTRDRFSIIWWNIHLSNPEEDRVNDARGLGGYDKLFRIKPLYDTVRMACKTHYHPRQQVSVDERMLATKAKTGMTQYMRDKPTKWGLKLFVLADSSNGYTVDFNMYTGKTNTPIIHGLAFDVVMALVTSASLGTGYHLYMDNFYSSPALFNALRYIQVGACGTYRENRKGCPRLRDNALTKKAARGSIRWLREDNVLFVKWMDTKEVAVCSTIHQAFSGEEVVRQVKQNDQWRQQRFPCPAPIMAYNRYMGGVDRSDQLLNYYSAHRRSNRWYRTVFLHLFDIATGNAFLLHKELTEAGRAMSHKSFMDKLCSELFGFEPNTVPKNRSSVHVPVPVFTGPVDRSLRATRGRQQCRRCLRQRRMRKDTPWKCQACGVALCLTLERNCFKMWHL